VARQVFHSFHFERDSHRVSQVRNMGVIEGQTVLSGNGWEEVKKGGDTAIQAWIDGEMKGRSCVVVLAGSATAGRKWVNYEVKKAWDDGRGLVGVYIHGLKNLSGYQDTKGGDPFAGFTVDSVSLSSIVKSYDPPYWDSKDVYAFIQNNLESWVEEAIDIRKNYTG
jgi:hypothetical protein